MLVLQLLHGRHRPDEILDSWGPDGPLLAIDWLHVTYFTTFCFGIKDGYGPIEFFIGDWKHKEQDGMLVEGLLHYDGMFYGDWEIYEANSERAKGQQIERFLPELANLPKDRNWEDIPKREECEYGDAT